MTLMTCAISVCSSLARLLLFKSIINASRVSRRAGKLNHHLEAAIHEAMSELDKMSGTVSCSHTLSLSHTCAHTRAHTLTHTRTHTCTHAPKHAHAHAHTHTHTHTLKHAHTHTHAHTRLAAIDGDDGYTGVKPQHRYVTYPPWHRPSPSF